MYLHRVQAKGNFRIKTPYQPLKAFPTAYGWAANATGGRGKPVYKVTNLNDVGVGSLRQALEDSNTSDGGIIVFEVAGYVSVASPLFVPNNTTVAGQTAFVNGGHGITIRSVDPSINHQIVTYGSNIIVRYLRFRRGGSGTNSLSNGDSSLLFSSNNVIIDHCSLSWSQDEVINSWEGAENITIQNSIISECFYNPDSIHSMGYLIGKQCNRHSLYCNLFSNNNQRNPLFGGNPAPFSEHEMHNCIMYNWGDIGTQFTSTFDASGFKVNIIRNKWVAGNNTRLNRYALTAEDNGEPHSFYVRGNVSSQKPKIIQNEWDIMGLSNGTFFMEEPMPQQFQSNTPFEYPLRDAPELSIQDLDSVLLSRVGASLYRDSIDERVISDYVNRTGVFINSPDDVGGYPDIDDISTINIDTSGDGMPDSWKTSKGLDPSLDHSDYEWGSGYVGVEEYLNHLAK